VLSVLAALGAPNVLALAAAPAAQAVSPRLAANVKPAPAYEAVRERLVAANPTPIFSDLNPTSMSTGTLKLDEPVQALAKVQGWDWILVGKDGVGIGYVPRALLKPAGS
jgi:hypothetical protein